LLQAVNESITARQDYPITISPSLMTPSTWASERPEQTKHNQKVINTLK
jgi:hypothetical protein